MGRAMRGTLELPFGRMRYWAVADGFTHFRLGGKQQGGNARLLSHHRLAEWFAAYCRGRPRAATTLPLHFPTGTPFQRAVWDALTTIPFGKTRTYQAVATQIGRPAAVRAVGQACGANPFPIVIPCHRVVSAHDLGGFSGPAGWKKRLLEFETRMR